MKNESIAQKIKRVIELSTQTQLFYKNRQAKSEADKATNNLSGKPGSITKDPYKGL